MKWSLLFFLFFLGCSTKDEFKIWEEKENQKLLLEDRENKELELIYLLGSIGYK